MAQTTAGSVKRPTASTALAEFEQVQKGRRYHQVARQIQDLISRGVLKPGDRLPAERELAAKLGVSRSSIRDAIRTLEVAGVVESHQGLGTLVRELSTDALVVPLANALLRKRHLVEELVDLRLMLEPTLAARAAENATDEEIAHLEAILRRQGEKLRQGRETIEEDSGFHYGIAVAARNSVLRKVLDILIDLLRESRARSLQVKDRSQRSYAGHQRILKAIKARDAAGAAAASRRHLKEIQTIVMRKL